MTKGRPAKANTIYKVGIHNNGGRKYASTQPFTVDENGKKHYSHKHWGIVDDYMKFHPNSTYFYASLEERRKLIFPSDWDLSEIKSLSGTGHRGVVEYDGGDLDRMYGPTWFLNNVAKETGLSDDLQKVFGGNVEMAQDVLTSIDLSTGVPEGMSFSKDTNLFYKQYNLDYKVQGNGNHVIDADRLKLNVYFDIHKRADDLARVQMAITTQTELVQAVYETGKPVPKEDRETFRKENNFMKIAFWKSGKIRSFEVDKDAVKKATLTSGFFASKTLGLDLDPMEARSRYGMRDEQEKTFMLQKGPLGEDRLRVCTESSKHGRMFICFVALILASYIRHIRDTKPELAKAFPSMAAILEEMQTIRCIEHDGRRKFITPFVGDQLLICDAFGFEVPEGCRPTYTSKKSNKGKRGRPPKPQTENS